jgi:hypothetical protein
LAILHRNGVAGALLRHDDTPLPADEACIDVVFERPGRVKDAHEHAVAYVYYEDEPVDDLSPIS